DLTISGIRGIKNSINIPLNHKSILIYGDNGTGKSSLADAIEWLYRDNVSHLSSSEIDLKEALRNSYINNSESSEISIAFNENTSLIKKLFYKKDKLVSDISSSTDWFTQYITDSKKENLLLRYHLLRSFVDQTKSDKLTFLSDIIGFSEVTKTKEILKDAFSSVKNEIKTQNFEAQINIQKESLISKIGAAVSQEKNLIEIINKIIKPLNLAIIIKSVKDIDIVLELIKKPSDTKQLNELSFLESIAKTIFTIENEVIFIDKEYQIFFNEFNIIASDAQSIMQTFLYELLKAGSTVIEKKYHKNNTCPLCLQQKNIEDLNAEIRKRLNEITKSSQKKVAFETSKQSVETISSERIKRLDLLLTNPLINDANNKEIKIALENIKTKFLKYKETTNKKVMSGDTLPKNDVLILKKDEFAIYSKILKRIETINTAIKNDKTTEIYANISAAKDAFLKIKRFENEKTKLEHQKKSLELIYIEFTKQQKEGLENFINTFSSTINDFYQYMNPSELFNEIRIVTFTTGEEDDLKGITIEYNYNGKWVSPPQKYFSESHLNCFGLAFFLASVVAFNKQNKFIILDDVISSFDTTHRKRFADLLFDKFSDYQIVLLTHEAEWFEYMHQLAKRNGWLIDIIRWSEVNGTYIDEKPADLKNFIEKKLSEGIVDTLGNHIRRYLEHVLKDICNSLEVKVSFRFNEINEKRMPDELLNALKSKIKEHGKQDWQQQLKVLDRITSSSILGNLLSHDNPFNHKIGDLTAFWADINELENIFYCTNPICTNRKISIKNYDTVQKEIRCGCGATKYKWQK
ncbi:MAG: AAA family ATPase, partial [Endomicrobiaceae bacterium]|nr:AAA family ATPase [Endomicrobiaceae bacterium]